jgi:hypothetical protein
VTSHNSFFSIFVCFIQFSLTKDYSNQLMYNPNFQFMLVVVRVWNFLSVVLVVHEEGVMGALLMLPYN